MDYLITACNQGDYTYTNDNYHNCRCGGMDEFRCAMRAIGDVFFNPMLDPGTPGDNNRRGERCS